MDDFQYGFSDTSFLDDEEDMEFKVLESKSMPLNAMEVIQISLVVVREMVDDIFTMYILERMYGEDGVIVECSAVTESQVREEYAWYFE